MVSSFAALLLAVGASFCPGSYLLRSQPQTEQEPEKHSSHYEREAGRAKLKDDLGLAARQFHGSSKTVGPKNWSFLSVHVDAPPRIVEIREY